MVNPGVIESVVPKFGRSASIAIFGAHPDDAVRACGGVMLRALSAGASLTVVKATDGAALYGPEGISKGVLTALARREEELRALEVLGVNRESLMLLGFPDGGLEALRNSYYPPDGMPYFDPWLAGDHVNLDGTYRRGARFFGYSLAQVVAEIVERCQPTHVFTHQSQDRHPDHRAMTFFVKAAISELLLDHRLAGVPAIFEYLTYHTRLKWPANPGARIAAQRAIELGLPGRVVDFRLSPEEVAIKNKAQECFVPILGRAYMDPWMRSNEIYWRTDLFDGVRKP